MQLILPFSTYLRQNPDFDAQDVQAEIEQLFERQSAIDDLLSGKQTPEYVLDLLETQGFDPSEYVDCVEVNVETAIASGLLPEDFDQLQ